MIGLYYHAWCFKTKNGELVPQWLTIGKPISQYASYAAMFCPLHSIISTEQHKKHLYNPSITENMEDSILIRAPHILICETHN